MSNSAGEIIYYIFKKLISILCIKKHFTEQRNYWTSVVNIYNILKRFWDLARPYGVPSLPCSRHIPPWKITIGCITLLNNIYPHSIMYFFIRFLKAKPDSMFSSGTASLASFVRAFYHIEFLIWRKSVFKTAVYWLFANQYLRVPASTQSFIVTQITDVKNG